MAGQWYECTVSIAEGDQAPRWWRACLQDIRNGRRDGFPACCIAYFLFRHAMLLRIAKANGGAMRLRYHFKDDCCMEMRWRARYGWVLNLLEPPAGRGYVPCPWHWRSGPSFRWSRDVAR